MNKCFLIFSDKRTVRIQDARRPLGFKIMICILPRWIYILPGRECIYNMQLINISLSVYDRNIM